MQPDQTELLKIERQKRAACWWLFGALCLATIALVWITDILPTGHLSLEAKWRVLIGSACGYGALFLANLAMLWQAHRAKQNRKQAQQTPLTLFCAMSIVALYPGSGHAWTLMIPAIPAQATATVTSAPISPNPITVLTVTNGGNSMVLAVGGTNLLMNRQVVGNFGPDGRIRQLTGQPFTDDDGNQLVVITNQGRPILLAIDQNGHLVKPNCLLCILVILLGIVATYVVWRCVQLLNRTNSSPPTNDPSIVSIAGLQSPSEATLSELPLASGDYPGYQPTDSNSTAIVNIASTPQNAHDWLGNSIGAIFVVTNTIFSSSNLATWSPETVCTVGSVGISNGVNATLMTVSYDCYDSNPFMTNWYSISNNGQLILIGGTGGMPPPRPGVPRLFFTSAPPNR